MGNGEKIPNPPVISSDLPFIFSITFSETQHGGYSIVTSTPLLYCHTEDIIQKRNGFGYFEVTIIHAPETHDSFLSIGLSERPVPLLHHIGWNKNSIGYHSDDGCLFIESYQGEERLSDGFGIGSVIGLGYYPDGTVFFTHDGILLERTAKINGILYPAIAATSNWILQMNIGISGFRYSQANL